MVRTQISLTAAQAEKVKRIAKRRGVSMSAILREQVDSLPDREATPADNPLLAIVGIAEGAGPTDVAVDHDRYLSEHDRW